MKLSTKVLGAAGFALAMVGTAANAGSLLTDWYFNPLGTGLHPVGGVDAQKISQYLNVDGDAFIQIAPTSPGSSTFSFNEHAVFNVSQADSNAQLFPVNYPHAFITATFQGTGHGVFGSTFSFDSGAINIYQNSVSQYTSTTGIYGADQGNLIATFQVDAGGGGSVDGTGNPLSNGEIKVFAEAKAPNGLKAGYFFRDSSGTDLSTQDVLSFAFTNANGLYDKTKPNGGLPPNLVGELACQYSGYKGAGCTPTADPEKYSGSYADVAGDHFFVANSGQFKLAEVPEPTSIALFGIAIFGAGLASRKRKA
jgi:hypothetical protein